MFIIQEFSGQSIRVAVAAIPLFHLKDVESAIGEDSLEDILLVRKARAVYDFTNETYLVHAGQLEFIMNSCDSGARPSLVDRRDTEMRQIFVSWAYELEISMRAFYMKSLEESLKQKFFFVPVSRLQSEKDVFLYAMRTNTMDFSKECRIIIDVSDDVSLEEWAFRRFADEDGRFVTIVCLAEGIPCGMAKHMIDVMLHKTPAWVGQNMFSISIETAKIIVDEMAKMLASLYGLETQGMIRDISDGSLCSTTVVTVDGSDCESAS